MLNISLLHAPDYMILTPQIEKSPYRGRGETPSHTLPPLGRFAPSGLVAPLPRICSQNIFCVFLKSEIIPPTPTFEDLSTPLSSWNSSYGIANYGHCDNYGGIAI